MELPITLLKQLASKERNRNVSYMEAIQAHASARKIYRLFYNDGTTEVGVINANIEENKAFINFSLGFKNIGCSVPEILATDNHHAYIQTDLGNCTLMDVLKQQRNNDQLILSLYKKAIDALIVFQTRGLTAINKKLCFQGDRFNGISIEKDVNYFCQEFLSRVGIDFESVDFSEDLYELTQLCEQYEKGSFMYRDFQARNIMVKDNELFFIDYQSGREGPLQYDLASLLFQSQANLPFKMREVLLDYYLKALSEFKQIDVRVFKNDYLIFALLRAIQNLGAYGKLGLGQGKDYFLKSIPFALKNCEYILNNWPVGFRVQNLKNLVLRVIENGN